MTTTLAQFIETARLTLKVQQSEDVNPNMQDSKNMDNWLVTLNTSRRQMSLYFSMGKGSRQNGVPMPPTLESVLDCLASDASGTENACTFEEWAREYGYDTDSRAAKKSYNVTKRQTDKLRALLGPEWFELLVWDTERQ